MDSVTAKLIDFATIYGIKVIGAIIILIIGRIVAGIAKNLTGKVLRKGKTDESIVTFMQSLIYALVIAFAVIAALAKFGVQTASIVAVMGAAGFAVGFALQGSLANFASGVMILLFRPFKVGDFIEGAGVAGTVKEIRLFNTILSTPDNVKVIVPNGKMSGDIIKNYSGFDKRRIDLVIGIGYSSSIKKNRIL